MDPGFPDLLLTENSCSKQQGNTLLPGFIDSSLLCHSFNLFVYIVYMMISAFVPKGTQDRLLKASLDGSVLISK